MDTKPLELEALYQIKALLGKYGFNYADLNYDEDGTDFLTYKYKTVRSKKYWQFLKSQSKGRDVSSRESYVTINQSYVTDDYLAFIYVKPKDVDETKTYLYTAEDIRNKWILKKGVYKLYLAKNFNQEIDNLPFLFNKERSSVIEQLLENAGKERESDYMRKMTDIGFYYKMWQETNGLPPIEYIRVLFEGDALTEGISMVYFIFILCASVIVNYDKNDYLLSIDWAFWYLKQIRNKRYKFEEQVEGRDYISNVAVTYYKTFVNEIVSQDDQVIGLHLHMGDDEESIDAQVMKDGSYGVVYNGEK